MDRTATIGCRPPPEPDGRQCDDLRRAGIVRCWWEPRAVYRRRLARAVDRLAASGHRLVFIAGCARSGTTLLRSLMACFRNARVCPVERGLEAYLEMAVAPGVAVNSPEILVVKRTHRMYRHLHLLPAAVDLVYCVRHPGDCLTSRHASSEHKRPFHVTRERWVAEYEGLLRLEKRQPRRRIAFVRYEDLVTRPDDVQGRLASSLGLEVMCPFSRNGLGIAIHRTSIARWRREPTLADAALSSWRGVHGAAHLADFTLRFGYEPDVPSGSRP